MAVLERETTTLGTPRAETWDDEWFAFVEAVEARLGHRVCGAHAPDHEPCELRSTHSNGRCRFHGGHPRIGAQPGNTNALIHGLYSRRIRTCGATCAIWDRCPMAGEDVTELEPNKRPQCVYERAAFDAYRGLSGETIAPERSDAFGQAGEGAGGRGPSVHGGAASVSGPVRTRMDRRHPNCPGHDWEPADFRRALLRRRINRKLGRGVADALFSRYRPRKVVNTRVGVKITRPQYADTARGALGLSGTLEGEGRGAIAGRGDSGFRRNDRVGVSGVEATDRAEVQDTARAYARAPGSVDGADRGEVCAPVGAVADTCALLYAMVQRAAIHVAAHRLTDTTYAGGEQYTFHNEKVGAGVNAFLYLARELRAWVRLGDAIATEPRDRAGDGPTRPQAASNVVNELMGVFGGGRLTG